MRVFSGGMLSAWLAPVAAMAALSVPRLPVALLQVQVPHLDSADREAWARDLGKNLASDSAFLVYDLRTPHGAELDRALASGTMPEALGRRLSGGLIRFGLTVQCREENAFDDDASLVCRFVSWNLDQGVPAAADSAAFVADLLDRPADLQTVLTDRLHALLLGDTTPAAAGPALTLFRSARPARLLRGDAITARGTISALPLGGTLQTGDMPAPAAAGIGAYDFFLYPHSSYTYLLPGVLRLNRGELGVMRRRDTAGFAAPPKSRVYARLGSALWKTTARLGAMDSAGRVWRALGRLAALDSSDFAAGRAAGVLQLPPAHPLCTTLAKLAARDSGLLVIQTLAQIAALDSSRLLWSGFGRASGLDSNAAVWQGIAALAVADSGAFWPAAALLSAHGDALMLTPSCVLRGRPALLWLQHTGDWTRVELPQGTLLALPVLSSEEPWVLQDGAWAETRGFALQSGTLTLEQSNAIAARLNRAAPHDDQNGVTEFLARRRRAGHSIPTFAPGVQEYMRETLSEIGAAPGDLNAEPDWPPLGLAPETGRHASGCYLCRPDRLGP